jgi:hypothetical protein
VIHNTQRITIYSIACVPHRLYFSVQASGWSHTQQDPTTNSKPEFRCLQSNENGKIAALRARFIAVASIRWCGAQVPEIRRGRIFPRSGM